MASKLSKQTKWGGLCISILFFVGTLVLVNSQNVYVSPDETANAFFANQFSDTGNLSGPEDPLLILFDRLHPRSTLVYEGHLVPGSFLGLPVLYGAFVFVFGSWILWILTPLMTIWAAYAWRNMVEKFTNPTIGFLSFLFFLLHPAVWYYSTRGLMHNVLFLNFLIISGWFWLVRPLGHGRPPSVLNDILAGLCLGLALFVRTSEFFWIGLGLMFAGIVWLKHLSWRRLRAGLFGLIIGISPIFLMNLLTYGDPLTTGYTLHVADSDQASITETIDTVELLPFGLNLQNASEHLFSYGLAMFWWLSLLALPGFVLLFLQKPHRRNIRWLIVLATGVSAWLVLMYGSWDIHDNPDPTQITMANSYVRYWLPMYLFTTPMIAMTIHWLSALTKRKLVSYATMGILVGGILGLNVFATFLQGQDGLVHMREELAQSAEIQASVLRYTEPSSVIIVDRGDKLFFPHRSVWYPLRDEQTYESMPRLLEEAPLYYYGITFPEADIMYLNQSRLKRMGLGIEYVDEFGEESLYRIVEQ